MPLYYIDFSTWTVEADNQNQAIIKAQHYLKQGNPAICNVELLDDQDNTEHIEYETAT